MTINPDDIRRVADELKDDLVGFARRLMQTPSMSGEEEAVWRLTVSEMQRIRTSRRSSGGTQMQSYWK